MKVNSTVFIFFFSLSTVIVPFFDIIDFNSISLSLSNLLILIIPLIAILSNKLSIKKKTFYIIVLLFFILFLQLVFYRELIVWKSFTLPLLILLSVSSILKKDTDIEKLFLFISIFLLISCVIAIFQFFNFEFSWSLRGYFKFANDKFVEDLFITREKIFGLSYYSIQLGYQIGVFAPFIFYFIVQYNSKLAIIGMSILVVTSFLSGSVSAVISIFILFALYNFTNLNRKKFYYFLFTIFILSIFILYYSDNLLQPDKLSRIPLISMGLISMIDYPLGHPDPSNAIINTYIKYYNFFQNVSYSHYAETFSSHNSLINVGIRFGILFSIFYLFLFIFSFYQVNQRIKDFNDNDIRLYRIATLTKISLIIFFLQSMVHNAGLQSGDLIGWLIIILIMQLENINKNGNI